MEILQGYGGEWNGKVPMIDLSRFANVPPTVAVCHVRKIAASVTWWPTGRVNCGPWRRLDRCCKHPFT